MRDGNLAAPEPPPAASDSEPRFDPGRFRVVLLRAGADPRAVERVLSTAARVTCPELVGYLHSSAARGAA